MEAQPKGVTQGGPSGVGGWLLLFCVGLLILSPLLTLANLISSYREASPLFEQFPGLHRITIIDFVLSIGLMCFSMYAGLALWRKKQGAVRTAKRYLIVFLLYTVVASILPFMAGLPSEASSAILPDVFKDGLRSVLFFVVWISYLHKSRRIQNTFPDA